MLWSLAMGKLYISLTMNRFSISLFLLYSAKLKFVCSINIKEHIPKIPGIKDFSGRVIHSHIYRHPEEFVNQTVVVLGASFSGLDISIDINPFARKIYLSHQHDRWMWF